MVLSRRLYGNIGKSPQSPLFQRGEPYKSRISYRISPTRLREEPESLIRTFRGLRMAMAMWPSNRRKLNLLFQNCEVAFYQPTFQYMNSGLFKLNLNGFLRGFVSAMIELKETDIHKTIIDLLKDKRFVVLSSETSESGNKIQALYLVIRWRKRDL